MWPSNITIDEAKIAKLYVFQAVTRPVMLLSFTGVYLILTLTVSLLLVMGKETITTTSALLMTLIGTLTPIISIIVAGRSYEKVKGATVEAAVKTATDAMQETLSAPSEATSPDDPFATLASMDLSEFLPKVADDNPVVK